VQRRSVSLDNRIFALQKTKDLPEDLRLMLFHADVVYIQNSEDAAEYLVGEIERECQVRGIRIFDMSTELPSDYSK